jgi:glycosyltransferase involved in cell wall biosynthesis
MKICHIAINNIFLPPHEGGGVHEFEIAKNLCSIGNEIYMFIDKKDESDKKVELIYGVHVQRLNVYRMKRELFGSRNVAGYGEQVKTGSLKQEIKKTGVKILGILLGAISVPFIISTAKRCDIIYERSSSFGAGIFASLILRKPVVVEVVDMQRCGFLLRFADNIVTHSDYLIPKYISRDKILVTENAVDHAKFNPKVDGSGVRKKYGIERNRVVTYTGGFHPWHALDKIVAAAKKIVNEFPDVRFLMVGEGSESKHVIDMVSSNGLEKNFVFTGKIAYDKIPEFLAASDILVSLYTDKAYLHVSTTTKLCEYMAMGKPIIVYGVKEGLIKHMESGMLIKPKENIEEKLEEYCIGLLKNKKMREKLGNKSWKAVYQISWKDKAKIINDVFKKSLN